MECVKFLYINICILSLVAHMIKRLPAMLETQVLSLGQEEPLEKEMATHFSTLAWEIPWTEEPDRLQSMGLQRVRHDWMTTLQALCILSNINYKVKNILILVSGLNQVIIIYIISYNLPSFHSNYYPGISPVEMISLWGRPPLLTNCLTEVWHRRDERGRVRNFSSWFFFIVVKIYRKHLPF